MKSNPTWMEITVSEKKFRMIETILKNNLKTESIADYLKRGGKIQEVKNESKRSGRNCK